VSDVSFTLPNTPEIVELATRKFEADIRHTDAEIATLEGEQSKVHTEVRAQKALVRQLTADARVSELHAVESELAHSLEMARNFHHCVYRFSDEVMPEAVEACISTLTVWDRLHPGEPFEIVFNSPGGSVIDGFDLFDFIQEMKRKGHYVTTAARGWAASMGGILLQAGDKRVMGREAYMLIHEISSGYRGKTSEIEDEVQFVKKMQKRVLDIFERRSAQAMENGTAEIAITAHQIENGDDTLEFPGWKRRDRWLDSEECLKFGLVDELR
jgi:ATP-dependent Clp endopeptidase proteolytic subunit ClpP